MQREATWVNDEHQGCRGGHLTCNDLRNGPHPIRAEQRVTDERKTPPAPTSMVGAPLPTPKAPTRCGIEGPSNERAPSTAQPPAAAGCCCFRPFARYPAMRVPRRSTDPPPASIPGMASPRSDLAIAGRSGAHNGRPPSPPVCCCALPSPLPPFLLARWAPFSSSSLPCDFRGEGRCDLSRRRGREGKGRLFGPRCRAWRGEAMRPSRFFLLW